KRLLHTRDFAGARDALGHAEKSTFLAADCAQLRSALDLAQYGRDPKEELKRALTLAPENWEMRKRYIEYLRGRGAVSMAAQELRDFALKRPFRAEAWRLLGAVLEEIKQPQAAGAAWREAACLDVRDAAARS